jgi:hypothetical protein
MMMMMMITGGLGHPSRPHTGSASPYSERVCVCARARAIEEEVRGMDAGQRRRRRRSRRRPASTAFIVSALHKSTETVPRLLWCLTGTDDDDDCVFFFQNKPWPTPYTLHPTPSTVVSHSLARAPGIFRHKGFVVLNVC